jgi:hypothetical protein
MRDDHGDELVWQTSQEKADAVSHLFVSNIHPIRHLTLSRHQFRA